MFSIEPISDTHRAFVGAQIAESWAGPYVVSKGIVHDTRKHPGFVALEKDAVVGYILYNIVDKNCEITVLESLRHGCGITFSRCGGGGRSVSLRGPRRP
jgi:hypothetical protein